MKTDRLEVSMDIFSNEVEVRCAATSDEAELLMLAVAAEAVAKDLDITGVEAFMKTLVVQHLIDEHKIGGIRIDLGGVGLDGKG